MSLLNRENGRADAEERARDEQRKERRHMANLQSADAGESRERPEYLRELTKYDGLDPATKDLLGNFLSPDFILSNLQDPEVNEIKWTVRAIVEQVKGMHPPSGSDVRGERRQFLLDDADDALRPLTAHQEQQLDQAVMDVIVRVVRSRDGFQQEEMSKQVKVSRTEDGEGEDGDSGGIF